MCSTYAQAQLFTLYNDAFSSWISWNCHLIDRANAVQRSADYLYAIHVMYYVRGVVWLRVERSSTTVQCLKDSQTESWMFKLNFSNTPNTLFKLARCVFSLVLDFMPHTASAMQRVRVTMTVIEHKNVEITQNIVISTNGSQCKIYQGAFAKANLQISDVRTPNTNGNFTFTPSTVSAYTIIQGLQLQLRKNNVILDMEMRNTWRRNYKFSIKTPVLAHFGISLWLGFWYLLSWRRPILRNTLMNGNLLSILQAHIQIDDGEGMMHINGGCRCDMAQCSVEWFLSEFYHSLWDNYCYASTRHLYRPVVVRIGDIW